MLGHLSEEESEQKLTRKGSERGENCKKLRKTHSFSAPFRLCHPKRPQRRKRCSEHQKFDLLFHSPNPPARVESKNANTSGSVLKRFMAAWRSCHEMLPSMRQACTPSWSR